MTVRPMAHQVSPTWHDEKSSIFVVELNTKRIIDNSSCSWAQYCTRVIEMPFLERAAEFNPPTWSHRRLFDFQITHLGYGETWKEKGVVKTYSMKLCHPNHPLPCARLKSFTSLDNNTSLIWATKTSDVDIPYAMPKYRRVGETCRYRSAHPSKYLRASARPPQLSPLEISTG